MLLGEEVAVPFLVVSDEIWFPFLLYTGLTFLAMIFEVSLRQMLRGRESLMKLNIEGFLARRIYRQFSNFQIKTLQLVKKNKINLTLTVALYILTIKHIFGTTNEMNCLFYLLYCMYLYLFIYCILLLFIFCLYFTDGNNKQIIVTVYLIFIEKFSKFKIKYI